MKKQIKAGADIEVTPSEFEEIVNRGRKSKVLYWEVENVAQYEKERFEFSKDGIIVVKGRNSSGKSNALRSLQAALSGMWVSTNQLRRLVRRGKKDASVRVVFDDGVELLYQFGLSSLTEKARFYNEYSLFLHEKGKTKLLFNSKANGRRTVQKEVPEPIKRYLNLGEIQSNYLNFIRKNSKSTVLDQTPASLAVYLGKVIGSDNIDSVLKAVNADQKVSLNTLRSNQEKVKFLDEELKQQSYLTEELVELLNERQQSLNQLSTLYQNLVELSKHISVLSTLKITPRLDLVDTNAFELIRKSKELVDNLPKVNPQVDLVDIKSLEKLSAIKDLMNNLPQVTPQVDLVELSVYEELLKLKELNQSLPRVTPEVTPIDYGSLEALMKLKERLLVLNGQSDKVRSISEELDNIATSSQNELRAIKEKGGQVSVCRACGELTLVEEYKGEVVTPSCTH